MTTKQNDAALTDEQVEGVGGGLSSIPSLRQVHSVIILEASPCTVHYRDNQGPRISRGSVGLYHEWKLNPGTARRR